jgi:hypothetical protein
VGARLPTCCRPTFVHPRTAALVGPRVQVEEKRCVPSHEDVEYGRRGGMHGCCARRSDPVQPRRDGEQHEHAAVEQAVTLLRDVELARFNYRSSRPSQTSSFRPAKSRAPGITLGRGRLRRASLRRNWRTPSGSRAILVASEYREAREPGQPGGLVAQRETSPRAVLFHFSVVSVRGPGHPGS